MGVGGDDSWGAHTHDEYKLFADRDYAYTYRLRPLTDVGQALALSRRPVETAGGGSGPQTGVYYRLVAQHSGKAADINGAFHRGRRAADPVAGVQRAQPAVRLRRLG